MFTIESPVRCGQCLKFAVHGFMQTFENDVVGITCEQRIPVRTPHHLDHVPAGAAEQAFEFLNDRAIAAYRPVKALQIAVHDEDEVVEPLASGERAAEVHERVGDLRSILGHVQGARESYALAYDARADQPAAQIRLAGRRAELERLILAHWRRRRNLEGVKAAEAIATLRRDPEAGALLFKLEEWLHSPVATASVDVASLLEPYRNVADTPAGETA